MADALALHPAPDIVHSDKGCQYTSREFRRLLARNRIIQSMTGAGGWVDNAHIESFFKTLKYRFAHLHSWEDLVAAEEALKLWFYYYNYVRPHSALGGRTPASVFWANRPSPRPQPQPTIQIASSLSGSSR